MWREFNLINSYTLECSFCGPTRGLYNGCHFNTTLMAVMGRVFCKTLVDYVDNEQRVKQIWSELLIKFPVNSNANNLNNKNEDKDNKE